MGCVVCRGALFLRMVDVAILLRGSENKVFMKMATSLITGCIGCGRRVCARSGECGELSAPYRRNRAPPGFSLEVPPVTPVPYRSKNGEFPAWLTMGGRGIPIARRENRVVENSNL